VQPGETLLLIADYYGVNPEWIAKENLLTDPSLINVGMLLDIPIPQEGPSINLIPNSELIYSPAVAEFDIQAFLEKESGYLRHYKEDVESRELSSAEIIDLVAHRYSVNPRLLIALIEYQSGWLHNNMPSSEKLNFPLGFEQWGNEGLYKQLTWAANRLNYAYYRRYAGEIQRWTLADHSMVLPAQEINAGTAGLQYFFSQNYEEENWYLSLSADGFIKTYLSLFGSPFPESVEPALPISLSQPVLQLPFAHGEEWFFTGSAHEGWDTGSPWAAIDFAPPGAPQGCAPRDEWIRVVADGIVTYSDLGWVLLDLDGDNNGATGWVIVYTHISNRDRVQVGTKLQAGERIGHPSCEGGVASAAHAHIARRYNGQWIPAVGDHPFILDDWVLAGGEYQYIGYLLPTPSPFRAVKVWI
jgi:murein DD-endopeptidase MepM/ murein hydrolase activator NlpD